MPMHGIQVALAPWPAVVASSQRHFKVPEEGLPSDRRLPMHGLQVAHVLRPAVRSVAPVRRSWRALGLAPEGTKGSSLHPEALKARMAAQTLNPRRRGRQPRP